MMDDARPVSDGALLADALAGLGAPRKTLPPKWLYDARGSALFERITTLPEYYQTRTETAILQAHADRLAGLVPPGGALVELGSGASIKTRILLDAGRHFGAYVPIDISADFLAETAAGLRLRYPGLPIHPVVADFTARLSPPPDLAGWQKVGFFPGSTIGNLPRETAVRLLADMRGWPGIRHFILGADLVKDPSALVAAYDDAQGVTAAFIGNILRRLNTEAGATFDPGTFGYRANWDADRARIDMELVSKSAQTVTIAGTPIRFDAGEPIHVSSARKYTADSVAALAADGGWQVDAMLTDPQDRFAVCLLKPAADA